MVRRHCSTIGLIVPLVERSAANLGTVLAQGDEGEVPPLTAGEGEMDPHHGDVLEHGGVAERAHVDGRPATLAADLDDGLLGLGVVPRQRHVRGVSGHAGIGMELGITVLPANYRSTVAFLIIIAVLFLRPEGLQSLWSPRSGART